MLQSADTAGLPSPPGGRRAGAPRRAPSPLPSVSGRVPGAGRAAGPMGCVWWGCQEEPGLHPSSWDSARDVACLRSRRKQKGAGAASEALLRPFL